MDSISRKLYCCNPFMKKEHTAHKKNLRAVSKNLLQTFSKLQPGDKICDGCRKLLQASEKECNFLEKEIDQKMDIPCSPEKNEMLRSLNDSLEAFSESSSVNESCKKKLRKAASNFKTIVFSTECDSQENLADCCHEIIAQLKEKFNSTGNKDVKMQILTVLPKSWTLKKIEDEFGVTNYTARKAKELVKQKGVLSSPDPKPGKTLDATTAKAVIDFYESEEISRCMPGKKDFVSIKVGEKREHVQKKLILCNLHEVFCIFKTKFPLFKVGFSKFCELRPKHCVLAGESGTHSVCVCVIHQNAKLVMSQCKLPEFSENEKPIKTYNDILKYIICETPTNECYFQKCDKCPGFEEMRVRFKDTFALNFIENVTYRQWVKSEKITTLETFVKPTDEFINTFFLNLPKLLEHSFIAKQQSSHFIHLKETLKIGEFLITCDFSENYSFILQDAAQGFHWNNAQATIHPFSVYYQNQEKEKGITHISVVVISDCLIHNNVAVHLFQKHLIKYLQFYFNTDILKIYYYSDGAGSQYKNRFNFINLCFHETDFNIKAEWHFFATSHGKSACDGIGGTIKRLAARSSLQMVYNNQIMTPRQLYEWAKENIKAMHFIYSTIEEHKREEICLKNRRASARTIPGTQKLHSFVPLNKTQMQVKTYSFSSNSRIEKTKLSEGELQFSDLVGFVTCKYDEHWWLGCILNSNEETEEVNIKFLHPHGPSPTYKYPNVEDILWLNAVNILTKVDPSINLSGRVYSLSKKETELANLKLQNYL